MRSAYEVAGRIRRAQRSVMVLWPLVLRATSSQSTGDRVTSSKEAPAPISAHLLDVRKEVHHDLRFYAMLVLEQVNSGTIAAKVDALDVGALAGFIDTWALHLAEQFPDDAEQCALDLERHVSSLSGLVRGDQTHRYHLGRCPEVVMVVSVEGFEELTRCTGTLVATMRSVDSMLPKDIVCEVDGGHTWAPHQWAMLGKRIGEAS